MNLTLLDQLAPQLLEEDVFMTRGTAPPGVLEGKLFGAPRLIWRGTPLQFSSAKTQALLYALALRPEGLSRNVIAELLWEPGRFNNVRQALYQLRQLPGAHVWLEDKTKVRAKVTSNVAVFRHLVRTGQYADALAFPNEPLLADVHISDAPAFMDWVEQERAALIALRREALRGDLARLEASGHPRDALERALALLELDPSDEVGRRAATQFRRDDVASARVQVAAGYRMSARDLGVEPLPLEARSTRAQGTSKSTCQAALPPQLLRPPHLVGRGEVWARMEEAVMSGKAVLLTGAAGTGKTRLLRDFAAHLGRHVVSGAQPGDAPYTVLAGALRRFLALQPDVQLAVWEKLALAQLLPHVPEYAPGLIPSPLDTLDKRARFEGAVASLLARLRRSVAAFALDDLQQLDTASSSLLAQVASPFVGERAALLMACRTEDDAAVARARQLATRFEAEVVHVALPPLIEAAVTELLTSLELPGGTRLARRLHRDAAGNPMRTLEALRLLVQRGDLDRATWNAASQADLRRASLRRLEKLSPTALRAAQAKALVRGASVTALGEILELRADALSEGIAELERAHVVRGGRFVHEMVAELTASHVPVERARALHERAARVLAASASHCPAQVAHHWLRAGKGAKAAPHLLQAAQAARRLRADETARLRYFQVLWCTSDEDTNRDRNEGAVRSRRNTPRLRALQGLGKLAELTGDLQLRADVLKTLEPAAAAVFLMERAAITRRGRREE